MGVEVRGVRLVRDLLTLVVLQRRWLDTLLELVLQKSLLLGELKGIGSLLGVRRLARS